MVEKRPEDRRTSKMSLRIEPRLRKAVERRAADRGVKMSVVVRSALKDALMTPETGD
jgi:predicted HicB family RNase H-like nuclease